jgi:hypothetical protein
MSIDPYHAVQREIQASLQSASQLQSSYTRIRSMAKEGSEELMWARNEVRSRVKAYSYYRINPCTISSKQRLLH